MVRMCFMWALAGITVLMASEGNDWNDAFALALLPLVSLLAIAWLAD